MHVDLFRKVEDRKLVKRLKKFFLELVESFFIDIGFYGASEIIKTRSGSPQNEVLFFQRGLRNDTHAAEIHGHRTEELLALMQDMQIEIERS